MHLIVSIVAALALLHSCQAQAEINFMPSRTWLNQDTIVRCTSYFGLSWSDVKAFRFWGLHNTAGSGTQMEFNAEKPNCNDPNVPFTVTKNTAGSRLSLDTSSESISLHWKNVTLQDQDSYMCALTPCWDANTEFVSQNVEQLVVVTPPEQPELLAPAEHSIVEANKYVDLNVTCRAYAGYPHGLTKVYFQWMGNTLYAHLPDDGTGHFYGSHVFRIMLQKNSRGWVTCETYNTAGGGSKTEQDIHEVLAQ